MNGHTRLVKRNMTYYIRARIPTALTYLTKSAQFMVSADVYLPAYKLQPNNHLLKLLKYTVFYKSLRLWC